jgi:putative transcriptional regulator
MFYKLCLEWKKMPIKNERKNMTTERNKFSELVKTVRKQLSLTQEEMANKLGVSFATINRWENGKTTPSQLARTQFDALYQGMKNKSG